MFFDIGKNNNMTNQNCMYHDNCMKQYIYHSPSKGLSFPGSLSLHNT